MHFTKPAWVVHQDSMSRGERGRGTIYSCHVHPDGSRIATGGIDAKVRIWSTKPILNHASELAGRPPKSLCTLGMHTGPVLCVRWAHSGRWLASGSDDTIIMIWDLDPSARGKVWGSDEINVEGWKPLKRLPGHESDVTDIAWSPGDRYLASVGLDSQIIIWCGFTLERLRRLDSHQGFVKGVCWDPVGEFLATQSDDRSVKVWRTTDWEEEAEVKKPFDKSPITFFRRPSWSPDGAHITAANATNNNGYVFIAAVIARNSWTSEISLVGHENVVEVAAYNPHIFLRDPTSQVVASNICSVVALGADDHSISVWQTKSARPLVVAKEVFDRQIMDLSWSSDGLTLYAVSSDGTMAVFSFDENELEGIAPASAQDQYLKKFGFTPPSLPEGFSHKKDSDSQMTPPPSPGRTQATVHSHDDFGAHTGGEQVNMLVAKRNVKKKRLQPTFVGSIGASVPSAANPHPDALASTSATAPPKTNGRSFHEIIGITSSSAPRPIQAPSLLPESLSSANAYSRGASGGLSTSEDTLNLDLGYPEDVDMTTEVQISALDTSGKGKRKASVADLLDDRPSKPRTLGGDRVRDTVVVRELAPGSRLVASEQMLVGPAEISGTQSLASRLPMPPLLTYLKAAVEGSEDILEGRNSDDGSPNEVIYISGKQTQWLDYVPSPILALVATSAFCAVAMEDGSLNVYSPTGRRLMPTMSLGFPCSALSGAKNCLMLLTLSGQLHVWNVKQQRAVFPPTTVHCILGSSPNCTILTASVRPNGAPIFQLSTGAAHSYDPGLCAWTKVGDGWWAEGSDAWQGRQRGNSQLAARGIVSVIESAVSEHTPVGAAAEKARPAWWSTALTLGHLETRLHTAKALDSPQEYKHALVLYAKKVADEGFRAKAEELVKELFGPVYWRPGTRDDSWSPTVLGLAKRDLLKDVLAVFARSKTLTKLAIDWQDTLKKAASED